MYREARDRYYNNKFNNVQGDCKRTWEVINEVLGRKQQASQSTIKNTNENSSRANFIKDFFVKTVDDIKQNCDQSEDNGTFLDYLNEAAIFSMHCGLVKEKEINEIIKNIKSNSCGLDGIHPEAIRLSREYLSRPLTFIVNLSFKSGCFPTDLKMARVVPIHKSG